MTNNPAVLPASLIKTRNLAPVREGLWSTARQRKNDWSESWDVAAWLRFSATPAKAVGLLLHFVDADGAHAVMIDEATPAPGSSVMLLSGRVRIQGRGALESLALHYSGVEGGIETGLDSLHIQPVAVPVAKAG